MDNLIVFGEEKIENGVCLCIANILIQDLDAGKEDCVDSINELIASEQIPGQESSTNSFKDVKGLCRDCKREVLRSHSCVFIEEKGLNTLLENHGILLHCVDCEKELSISYRFSDFKEAYVLCPICRKKVIMQEIRKYAELHNQ